MARPRFRPGPKKTYGEQLKDPQWQRRRLEILSRDGFACRLCGCESVMLHVHHRWYGDGAPWDVAGEALLTLCETCHEEETREWPKREAALVEALERTLTSSETLGMLADAFRSSTVDVEDDAHLIAWVLRTPDAMRALKALSDHWYETGGDLPHIPNPRTEFKDDQYAWIADEWDGQIIPLTYGAPDLAVRMMVEMAAEPPVAEYVGGKSAYHPA